MTTTITETASATVWGVLPLAGLSMEEVFSELAGLDIWRDEERAEIKRVEENPTFVRLGNLIMDVIHPAKGRSKEVEAGFQLLMTRWMEMRPDRYKALDLRGMLNMFAEMRLRSCSFARSVASLGMPAPARSVDYEVAISTVATAAQATAGKMDAAALEVSDKTRALYSQYNEVARAYNNLRAQALDLDAKRKEEARYYNHLCEKGDAV